MILIRGNCTHKLEFLPERTGTVARKHTQRCEKEPNRHSILKNYNRTRMTVRLPPLGDSKAPLSTQYFMTQFEYVLGVGVEEVVDRLLEQL
jgi:hypothetical protein